MTPVLGSPSHVVLGARDLDAAAAYYGAFGFEPVGRRTVPADAAAAVYGLPVDTEELELQAAGAHSGHLLLVAVDAAASHPDDYERGAHALDVYSTDLDASAEVAAAAGGRVRSRGTLDLGPLVLQHLVLDAPDDVMFVLLDANRRRPSLLDHDAARVHSEAHSLIWAVDDIDEALPFWGSIAGLTTGPVIPVEGPGVAGMLGLPDGDVQLRMTMLSDDAVTPMRLELLEYVGRPGPARASWPVTPGLHAVAFAVESVAEAVAALDGVRFGDVAEASDGLWRRAVTGAAPGGIRIVVYEAAE